MEMRKGTPQQRQAEILKEYASVDWRSVKRANLEFVVEHYRQRLKDTARTHGELESKARWVLALLLVVVVALSGFLFTNIGELSDKEKCALLTLAIVLVVSGISAAWSTGRRSYVGAAITPSDARIKEWEKLLEGGESEYCQCLGLEIAHIGEAIRVNAKSNREKECMLDIAYVVVCLAILAFVLVLVFY